MPIPLFDDIVTLVGGATFTHTTRDGSVAPDSPQGIYHHDLRVVSRLAMTVDQRFPPLLSGRRQGARTGTQVFAVSVDPHGSPTALLRRRRVVRDDVVDHYELTCYSGDFSCDLVLALESDFADLLERKAGGTLPAPVDYDSSAGTLHAERGDYHVDISSSSGTQHAGGLSWHIDLKRGEQWTEEVRISAGRAGPPTVAAVRSEPLEPIVASRLDVTGDPTAWHLAVGAALSDLDGLRVDVPDMGLRYIAAGAPWFMALFGRDALLTAEQAMIASWHSGLGILEGLAHYQGTSSDARTLEQPGRILHELRTGGAGTFDLRPGRPYYGTVDASPLFVSLLRTVHRWAGGTDRVKALLPAARCAIDWCLQYGDLDDDGYIEYASDHQGLANQGWKDSGDSMVHADGSQATGPIALAEVQAYLWRALHDLAVLEEAFGADVGEATRPPAELTAIADQLKQKFVQDFYLPDSGLVAMALDGDKRPLEVGSSNIGHVLASGIMDDDVALRVADRLSRDDLITEWGVRTLSADAVVYNPLSYHLGSVWPHDSAICATGFVRAGMPDVARRLSEGLLKAARQFAWRLPELFAGLDSSEVSFPVPYPVACSPQAWSATVPLALLQLMLGLEPDVPNGRIRLAPLFGEGVNLNITDIVIGEGTLSLRVRDGKVEITQTPSGLEIDLQPQL